MLTFASELEVRFPITLEANHVIDRKQVWAGSIGFGPTGHSLNATYHNSNSYGFQDEVGRLILNICSRVPHGILVFLPSYKLLNDLITRWQSTGLWTSLFEKKAILSEPKFGDELEQVMKEFYSVISSTNNTKNDLGQDGALFLAVCRGKVSEGLDFADNNARAVVCVGIPFPAVKDTLVDLKKKYNDNRKKQKPEILPGRDWYEIQAFRALNQALGRCIRHKMDWGAILMVDDRYAKNPRYVNSLSKWVRGRVVNYNNCAGMLESLNNFTEDMKQLDLVQVENPPPIPPQQKEPPVEQQEERNIGEKIDIEKTSSWSPKENETLSKRIAKLGKLRETSQPLRENKLIANLSREHLLDSQTHLNTDKNLNGLQSSVSSHVSSTSNTTKQIKGTKRKHSSSSEANLDIDDQISSPHIFIEDEGGDTAQSWNMDPPVVDDYLPNMVESSSNDAEPSPKYFRSDPVLKYSLLEWDTPEDQQLQQLLIERREMKQQKVSQIRNTPEKFEEKRINLNQNVTRDQSSSLGKKKSNRKPLFVDLSKEKKENTMEEVTDGFESDEDIDFSEICF